MFFEPRHTFGRAPKVATAFAGFFAAVPNDDNKFCLLDLAGATVP